METQSTEFPQFSLLPPEIRLQIWFYCLPRRIVQRDDPFYLDDVRKEQKCWSIRPTCQNAAPPLIASVCRESRQVVRQWGKTVSQEYWFNIGPIWIQPLLDGYNLNSDSMSCWDGDDFQLVMEFFDEGFHRLGMMPLSLRAEYFFQFNLDPLQKFSSFLEYPHFEIQQKPINEPNSDDPYNEFAVFSRRPYTRVSQSATLAFICIHATKEQAADSGLFGQLLDAPVQLVDFDDEERLRAFYTLFEKGCSNHKRPEVSEQFASILSPGFHSHVERWREKVDWLMMANAWRRAKNQQCDPIQIDGDPGLVWNPPLLDDQTWILLSSETHSQVNIFDDHHPWVLQTKKELPSVTPKVQFLLCTDECDVDGNVDMVRHMPIPRSGRSDWFGLPALLYADLAELP